MAIQLLVTDKNLVVQGDPLDGWTAVDCALNFNEPAAGSFQIPARPEVAAQLLSGRRIVLMRDGAIWCAGPIEEIGFERAVGSEEAPGMFTCRFTDDLARIAGAQTYPNPAAALSGQATVTDATYQLTATNAETIIRTLVDLNCGPGAIVARRIEQLVLDAVAGVGANRSITTRFEPLLGVCRTVAATDALGFRTRQDGTQIKFGVYAPVDRSATARFSWELGNLRQVGFTLGAPLATSELVIGGDEGAREFVEVSNAGALADWYRVEKVADQSGTFNTNGELTQAGTLAFEDDNPQAALSTVTIDTEDLQAGRDFGLGDLVTVAPYPGYEVADVVRSIRLTATPDDGEVVTSVVGTQDQSTATQTVRSIRDLTRRLGRLETRR